MVIVGSIPLPLKFANHLNLTIDSPSHPAVQAADSCLCRIRHRPPQPFAGSRTKPQFRALVSQPNPVSW